MKRPRIAITMGDPAGIGPETIVGAWADPTLHTVCCPMVVGNCEVMRRAVALLNHRIQVLSVPSPEAAAPTPECMVCLPAGDEDAADVPAAQIDARGGRAAFAALTTAAQLALESRVDALTTAPLHKAALSAAGFPYPGHTEALAELCGTTDYAMMLYVGAGPVDSPSGLAIVHVTLHTSLRQALHQISTGEIGSKCRLVHEFMQRLTGVPPRIGVCALNPHGGESGLFGDEEIATIAPAIEQVRSLGIDAQGPYPADTLFLRARNGEFDAVVAMYHDQGHIAMKLMAMHRAVNITLGLPIVRTSVAHGTAFDVAWRGLASASSMIEAIRVASRLAVARQNRT